MSKPSLSLKDTGRIYLDHNATTPPLVSILESVPSWLHDWGNPSSIHFSGRAPRKHIRDARSALSNVLECKPIEIVFTSGGSESNNLAIIGFYSAHSKSERNEYITTTVEHPSVSKCFDDIERRGAKVHRISVNKNGELDMLGLKNVLSERTALVSVMYANNETGSIFPIQEITEMAHAVGAKMHTDAVQALGKVPIQLQRWGVDMASFASHKVYALKGSGILYVKTGAKINSLILGGAQERRRRAGTENMLSIRSFGHVAHMLPQLLQEKYVAVQALRDEMESQILEMISGVQVTAAKSKRLPGTTSLIIDGVDGESLLISLDMEGVSVSTGAACSSGNPEPSPVLIAMGLTRAEAQKSLRVSLGWDTTKEEIEKFVIILQKVVERLRSFHSESREDSNAEV